MELKKIFLSVLFTVLASVYTFSQNMLTNPIAVEREDESLIRYYLELSDSEKPSRTLFLFLQGSDCNSVRNLPAINKIKPIFAGADLLMVEKYGITEALPYSMEMRDSFPEDYINFDNPLQRVSDASKVIDSLVKKYGYEKVLVLGGSEGQR